MLTCPRRRSGSLRAIPIPAEWQGNVPVLGNLGVVHPGEHPGGLYLLVPYDLGHVVNGGTRYGVVAQELPEVPSCVPMGRCLEEIVEFVPVLHPRRVG